MAPPTATVVFLAHDRRDDLRLSLTRTLEGLDYDRSALDVIVVDNASSDGTAEMVEAEFPEAQLIKRTWNRGVSGWNDGFAEARGDYVLALDDDCHLPPDGLRRAVAEAERHDADLVSFGVTSASDSAYRFDIDEYLTGLFSFWGCAVLVRRRALEELDGYDPEIFVWGNELELMLRFYDGGFRHLYVPDVVAVHARPPRDWRAGPIPEREYRMNAHNLAYIAAKLLTPRDAVGALVAQLARTAGELIWMRTTALRAFVDALRGFAHGLRRRRPVRREVSRTYGRNFVGFANPWRIAPSPLLLARDALFSSRRAIGEHRRRDAWLAERARFYPAGWSSPEAERIDVLDFTSGRATRGGRG